MKILPVEAELFRANGQKDGHDNQSSLFAILRRCPKTCH